MVEEQRESPEREDIPFDENPPVDPTVPQVGNSRARFVTPTDEEQQGEPSEEAVPEEGRGDEPGA